MYKHFHHKSAHPIVKAWIILLVICFSSSMVFPPSIAEAQYIMSLPRPGTMIGLSPAFQPAVVKGIRIYPDDPLRFDFIIDTGTKTFDDEQLRDESSKLVKYFLVTVKNVRH